MPTLCSEPHCKETAGKCKGCRSADSLPLPPPALKGGGYSDAEVREFAKVVHRATIAPDAPSWADTDRAPES